MTTPSLDTFGEILASHREHGGWTRREIADAAGVSTQFVTYLETGARNASEDTVERLIVALDLSPRSAGIMRRAATAERSRSV